MKKLIKLVFFLVVISSALGIFGLWKDMQTLKENLIRLHVVANSDSEKDQDIKLQVKDAIVNYLQPIMEKLPGKEEALSYLRKNIGEIEQLANQVLDKLGVSDRAVVTIAPEAFDIREYDTFSLPSGIYDALRIRIGEAEGKNWWCVVFPNLCVPVTSTGFQDIAASSGFSDNLTSTLSRNGKYQLRFFLLDCIGKIENMFI